MLYMRTNLTIEDKLAEALKEAAYRSKKSFKEVVDETLHSVGVQHEDSAHSKGTRRIRDLH